MSGVWYVILPVAAVCMLFVLKAVRDVARSMGKLVDSVQELRDAGVGLTKIRDEMAAQRGVVDDVPPQ